MAEEREIELRYVPRDLFDAQLRRIDESSVAGEKLTGLRFDKFQTSMEKSFEVFKNQVNGKIDRLDKRVDGLSAELKQTKTELQGQIKALDKKVDGVKAELNEKINALDIKIDGVKAELNEKINGVEAKLSEKIDGVNEKIEHSDRARNLWLAVLTLVVAVGTIIIPYFK